MGCVNHPESAVASYCQHCGKALCAACVRRTPTGHLLCDPCLAATGGNPGLPNWQQAAANFMATPPGTPNPAAAGVLGLIPGVGAMYNGQLFKGLIHIVIFAVLVTLTDKFDVFGFFIAGWVLYQAFEAYHTAKARRDGTPVPDPFGLNEVGNWFNASGIGYRPPTDTPVGGGPVGGPVGGSGGTGSGGVAGAPPSAGNWGIPVSGAGQTPGQSTGQAAGQAAGGTAGQAAWSAPPATEWQATDWQQPYGATGQVPYSGEWQQGPYSAPPIPPIPPIPPYDWRRREPVWAVVLILLGVLFLLNSMGFVHNAVRYAWPVLLIGLGIWLIVRRVIHLQGGPK